MKKRFNQFKRGEVKASVITVAAALHYLQQGFDTSTMKTLALKRVIGCVCDYYSVTESEVFSIAVRSPILEARQVLCWLLDDIGYPSREISTRTGINQASVVRSTQRVNQIRTVDKGLAERLKEVQALVIGSVQGYVGSWAKDEAVYQQRAYGQVLKVGTEP